MSRRHALTAALVAGLVPLPSCVPTTDVTPAPSLEPDTGPTPSDEPGGDPVPGELATHDPDDRILPNTDLFLSGDGSVIAALGASAVVSFDTATGAIRSRTPVDVPNHSSSQAWSLTGTLAATGADSEATVLLVDTATGRERPPVVLRSGDGAILGVASMVLSPDGEQLVMTPGRNEMHVFSTADATELRRFTVEGAAAGPARPLFAPDGRLVISSGQEQCPIQFWKADGSELLRVVDEVEQPYHHLQFSRAGRCFLLRQLGEEWSFRAEIRDSETFEELASHPLPVMGTTFSFHPAGTHLAWSGGDHTTRPSEGAVIHLLEVGSGGLAQLTGHEHPPHALVHSPDGSILYSASSREGIIAWDLVGGAQPRNFELP